MTLFINAARRLQSALAGLVVLLVVAQAVMSSAAEAQGTAVLRAATQPAGAINIVIVGDGYTAPEMATFATDAQAMLDRILAEQPFASFANRINAWRIDAVSVDSGVGETGTPRNTTLRGFLNCAGIARLYCIDTVAADDIVRAALPGITFPIRIAIGNTLTYGGAGYGNGWGTTTRNASAREVVVHEVGHSFSGLADEYDYGTCNLGGENGINTTRQTDRPLIPWNVWIDAATPIPTTTTTNGVPGLYQGAEYCTAGKYRPTYNSLMRNLFRPFEQVNEEQTYKRIRSVVRAVAGASPKSASLTVRSGELELFTALPSSQPLPTTGDLPVTWRVNGTIVGNGSTFTLDPATLPTGASTLTASAGDPSAKVRNDPAGALQRTITWSLTRDPNPAPAARTLTAVLPAARSTVVSSPATAFVSVVNPSSAAATGCSLATHITTGLSSVTWQETNPATNQPVGGLNPVFDVAGGGGVKTFVVALTPNVAFAARDFHVIARCANALDTRALAGTNALTLTASAAATPDIISISATTGTPGILGLPPAAGQAAFSVAAVNIGAAAAAIRVQPSGGGDALPVPTTICETNPSTGLCLAPAATSVTLAFAAGQTRTFSVFGQANGTIPFDPGSWRVVVQFLKDNGAAPPSQYGATSVAVRQLP